MDPNPEIDPETLRRFLSGQLSGAESAALFQRSLGNQRLFNELASAAFVTDTLSIQPPARPASIPRRWPLRAMGAALAAAALFGIWFARRPAHEEPAKQAPGNRIVAVTTARNHPPGLLTPIARSEAVEYRGEAPIIRMPRRNGKVTSVNTERARIGLGSLDGVEPDGVYKVFRGAEQVGTVSATAVHREEFTGTLAPGSSVAAGDMVRIGIDQYTGALIDQVDARYQRRDFGGAIQAARLALAAAPSRGPRLLVLKRLGFLQIEAKQVLEAKQSLQEAVAMQEDADSLNNLGAAMELSGDKTAALELYRRALRKASAPLDTKVIQDNLAMAGAGTR